MFIPLQNISSHHMIGFIPLHSYILIYFHKSCRYQPIITWFFELVLWTSLDSRDTAPTQITRKNDWQTTKLDFHDTNPGEIFPMVHPWFFPSAFPDQTVASRGRLPCGPLGAHGAGDDPSCWAVEEVKMG